MPKYQDATGYLLELREEVDRNWFSHVCDLAIQLNGDSPSESELEDVWLTIQQPFRYIQTAASVRPREIETQQSAQSPFLSSLGGFQNFKKLSESLALEFKKPITIVFGTNGAGKSSLCQALKILASPDKPIQPLHNVRESLEPSPAFRFKFRGWDEESIWQETSGFGPYSQFIKYFDSTVAISNVTRSLKVDHSVEVSVFRLEIFDFCRKAIETFRRFSSEKMSLSHKNVDEKIQEIKKRLYESVYIHSEPFSSWTPVNYKSMRSWVNGLSEFRKEDEDELENFINQLKQARNASSDQGRAMLGVQIKNITALAQTLQATHDSLSENPISRCFQCQDELKRANIAFEELARTVYPEGVNHSLHHQLLVDASQIGDLKNLGHCPLCLRAFDSNTVSLFERYSEILSSKFKDRIEGLQREITLFQRAYHALTDISFPDTEIINSVVSQDFINYSKALMVKLQGTAKSSLSGIKPVMHELGVDLDNLKQCVKNLEPVKQNLQRTLDASNQSAKALAERVEFLQRKVLELQAKKSVSEEKNNILSVCEICEEHALDSKSFEEIDFSGVLRKITLKAKSAHSELVLGQFESKLNEEYISLSGMSLEQIGVKLATKGSDSEILVAPNIGKSPVHRVLSEGEQKIHSIAVFMAEASANPNQVLVFDDPVTSFDYNYISNFCERVRDFHKEFPKTQMAFFTHNWDFFVNLQSALNKGDCNNNFSVQVVEGCSVVKEYSEKWEDLVRNIEGIIEKGDATTPEDKETLSGLLRRLVERLTNQYVFNDQRHQYKPKMLNDSSFREFTRIVPLLDGEATRLRDLYGNLSPSMHDDVRLYYTNKSIYQFERWYREILEIRDSLVSRRV